MKRIYLGLAVYSTVFLLGTIALGLHVHATEDAKLKSWHVLAGLFVAIFICFVHSLVFIHLLGTGLGIKRAIEEHKLSPGARAEIYRVKMRAFPPAFGSMVATIATAVLGGSALTGGSPTVHLALALAALVANVVTFPWVVKQLGHNERILRAVEAELAAATDPGGAGSPPAAVAPGP